MDMNVDLEFTCFVVTWIALVAVCAWACDRIERHSLAVAIAFAIVAGCALGLGPVFWAFWRMGVLF